MPRTQIEFTEGGLEQGFRRGFADGLDESLVSSVAQATVSSDSLIYLSGVRWINQCNHL